MIDRPLPEFCYSRRPLREIGGVVIHYFSAINVAPDRWDDPDTCFDLFLDLNTPGPERGLVMRRSNAPRYYASAHYLIDRDGQDYQLVPLDRQAYHAGRSEWADRDNLNAWTVGIEFIATHDSGFTLEQYRTGQRICAQLMSAHGFPLDNITGHEHVAPGRKKDPGPLFEWDRFKEPLRNVGRYHHGV